MNRLSIHQEESRSETIAAFGLSIFLHIFLLMAIAFFLLNPSKPPPLSYAEENPIQLTILPPTPATTPQPAFVSTSPQKKSTKKPKKDAPFESDNDSIAASEKSPTGQLAMPTLEGKDERGLEFHNRSQSSGKPSESAAANAAESASLPKAEAEPTPRMEAEIALLEKPRPKSPPSTTQNADSKPKPTASSGYQPETRISRIRGNISNRGRSSVEANATPLGRYKKELSDAIGSRWYYYVNSQMGLLNIGTVEIRFTVLPNGKVKAPQVLSNSSNESFASVCISAILQAELPAIPPEVSNLLENGRLEIDYSFSILGN